MGKSSKKSATKRPVAVPKSERKGKRGAENETEKAVSAKKQKLERDETVLAKQKTVKEVPKKVAVCSSDYDDDTDHCNSGSHSKVVAKKTPIPGLFPAKNGSVVTKKSKMDTSSDSSESDSDNDEKPVAKKQPAAVRKTPAADSSETSESDSGDDDDDAKPAGAVNNVARKGASSRDSCESDSDVSEEENVAKVAPAAAPKGKVESSESDSDEEKDSSDSNEEPKADKPKGTPVPSVQKPTAKQAQANSSEGSSDDESSDDESSKAQPVNKVQASKKSDSSDENESDEEKEQTSPKKDADVEMVDAEKSSASTFQKTQNPATPEPIVSKTLYVGNLSFTVEESDVREFFKDAGEVVAFRSSVNADGKFRGFGHVEFATVEAAQKAMELNDQELLGRAVRLDYARERSALTPQSGVQGQTAFVRGFDTSLGEVEIRSALQEHFGSCGEITRISIRLDYESGGVKKMAYMDFANRSGLEAALQKNDSDLGGGFCLNVQEAKSRGDRAGGRVDRGGKSEGERGGCDGGRFSGRGGRFSGRGGKDGGRGNTPNKSTVRSGKKKKTFWDD